MRTLASGWCPKHDRVYQRMDRCPDCGTALVRVEPPFHAEPKQESTLPEPLPGGDAAADHPAQGNAARRASWPRRGAIALALLAAFGLGSIIPEGQTRREAAEPVTREIHPRDQIARTIDGATIRLDLVRQTESKFTAVFAVGVGFLDPQQIEDAVVEVTTGISEDAQETYSVPELTVRPSRAGFTIVGTLTSSDPIHELRIVSIQVLDHAAPEWGADLSGVWPVEAEPRVLRVPGAAKKVEGGTIRLTALLCWRDRIEAVFELRDDEGNPGNRSEMAGFEMRTAIPNSSGTLVGRAIASSKTELVSASQLIVRFESIPENAGRVVILASRMLNFVAGPWIWRLP